MALYIQHATKDTSGTSTTIAFPAPTTAGNLIIVAVRLGGTATLAVTDPGVGNNWAAGPGLTGSDVGLLQSGLGTGYLFSAAQPSKPTTTLTLTPSATNTMRIAIYEYPGVSTLSPLDKTSSLYNASGAGGNSGNTATTTQADELVIGVCANNVADTTVAGVTQAYVIADGVPAAPNSRLAVEEVKVSVVGAIQADFTGGTSDRVCLVATYKLGTKFGYIPKVIQNVASRPRPFAPGIAR